MGDFMSPLLYLRYYSDLTGYVLCHYEGSTIGFLSGVTCRHGELLEVGKSLSTIGCNHEVRGGYEHQNIRHPNAKSRRKDTSFG